MANRRFSQAISEGDGISVIAAVAGPDAATAAEAQRAEAVVVDRDPGPVRTATTLPILCRGGEGLERVSGGGDAYVVVFETLADDAGRLEELYRRVSDLGLECVVDVRNEEELEQALDRVDPEIFLLSPRGGDGHEGPLDCVLDLLPNVPAGKLAVADLPLATPQELVELERAGVDAVIVDGAAVAQLVGGPPHEV